MPLATEDVELQKFVIRQGAAKNISLVYDNAINFLNKTQGNKNNDNVAKFIKKLEQEKDFATTRLMYVAGYEGDFKREFKEFTGKEYDEDAMKDFLVKKSSEDVDVETLFEKAYGVETVDKNGKSFYHNKIIDNTLKKFKYQEYLSDNIITGLSNITLKEVLVNSDNNKNIKDSNSYFDSYALTKDIIKKDSKRRKIINPEKELKDFVENEQKNGNVISEFVNKSWFSNIAPTYKEYPDETEKILTEVVKNPDGTVEPRFVAYVAEFLAPVVRDYPKEYEILKNEIKKDSKGNIEPRFSGFEIKDLAPLVRKYPNEYEKLKKETTFDIKGNVLPRFNGHELKDLIPNLNKAPDLYEYFINQTTLNNGKSVPRFDFSDIKSLVELYKKYPNSVDKIINIKNPNGTHAFNRYSGIAHLVKLNSSDEKACDNLLKYKKDNGEYFRADFYSRYNAMLNNPLFIKNNVQKLLDERFPEVDAPLLSRVKNLDTLNSKEFNLLRLEFYSCSDYVSPETLTKMPEDFSNSIDKGFYKNVAFILEEPKYANLCCSFLEKDKYYPNAKRLELQDNSNNKAINLVFDEKGTLLREDSTSVENAKVESEINKNSAKRTIQYKSSDDETLKIIKDDNNNIITTERRIPSESRIDTVYKTQKDRKEYVTEFSEQTPNKNLIIEKNIVSPKGIKNDYIYGEDNDGSRFLYNKIATADGKILSLNKKKLRHISDNLVCSVENGIAYETSFNPDSKTVFVTKCNPDGTKDNVVLKFGNQEGQISPELFDKMKNIPASTFFKLKQFGLKSVQIDSSREQKDNACYRSTNKSILISPELVNTDFTRVFLHEFGHFLDDSIGLSKDKKLLEIYNKEKEKFLANSTSPEHETMDYFISLEHKNEGGAITEVIAETYAMLNTVTKHSERKQRGMYLQQYFPETMAYIAQKIDS